MPAFNEEAVLPRALAEATAALDRLCDDWELVVVDDGSTDASPAMLAAAAHHQPRLRVLTQETNRGYAAALIRGFWACRREAVFYTDADAQFDLGDLARAYPLLAHADMVAGWRQDRQDTWMRKSLSAVFNVLQRSLLGTQARDVDCAFKLFRRLSSARRPDQLGIPHRRRALRASSPGRTAGGTASRAASAARGRSLVDSPDDPVAKRHPALVARPRAAVRATERVGHCAPPSELENQEGSPWRQ